MFVCSGLCIKKKRKKISKRKDYKLIHNCFRGPQWEAQEQMFYCLYDERTHIKDQVFVLYGGPACFFVKTCTYIIITAYIFHSCDSL